MIFIIGGRGRLGQAISSRHGANNRILLARSVYENWWQDSSQAEISRFFEPWKASNSSIIVAAGILDPKISSDLHLNVNYLLPKSIIEGVAELGLKVVTFGTVMEQLLNTQNSYIQSKARLGTYIAGLSGDHQVAHFRLHTLYGGGWPSPFMFLGQILSCLRTATEFKMTLGRQLREYHHVEDEALAVQLFLDSGFTGVTDLSHGHPVNLGALATHIFRAFNAEKLLRIGALTEPAEENYDRKFSRPTQLSGMDFRETLPAAAEYLKTCWRELENLA